MATDVSADRTKRIGLAGRVFLLFAPQPRATGNLVLPSRGTAAARGLCQNENGGPRIRLDRNHSDVPAGPPGQAVGSVAAYADELAAWAHNRRGELQAKQAVDLAQQDRQSEAAELDAQALADFETAVRMDPKNWKPLHNRGVSRALADRLDEALEDFSRVIELKPDYANAWFNRAEIRAERGELEDAVTDYTQAIKLKPEDTDARPPRPSVRSSPQVPRGPGRLRSRRETGPGQDRAPVGPWRRPPQPGPVAVGGGGLSARWRWTIAPAGPIRAPRGFWQLARWTAFGTSIWPFRPQKELWNWTTTKASNILIR